LNRAKTMGGLRLVVAVAFVAGCGGAQTDRGDGRYATLRCPEAAKWSDAELAQLRPESLKSVETVLSRPEDQQCWMSAVKALGLMSGAEAVADLRAFIETGRTELAQPENREVVQQVFFSLAQHARRDVAVPGARQALKYLQESTDPATWEKRGINWQLDAVMRRELIRDLSGSAVVALTDLTVKEGDPDYSIEAREHLTGMALDASDRHAFSLKYLTAEETDADVQDLVSLYVLPPGRVLYATGRVASQLTDDEAELKNLVLRVQELARITLEEERRWNLLRRGKADDQLRLAQANRIADMRLSGLHGQLDGLDRLRDDPSDQAAIDVLFDVMFPGTAKRQPVVVDDEKDEAAAYAASAEGGVQGLILQPHARQVALVLSAIETLRKEHKGEVARLELGPSIEVVEQAHLDLKRALESRDTRAGSDAVMRARSALQTGVRVLVATLIAHYPGARPADAERRHDLLRPLLVQNERVGDYFRSRQRLRDVDPATGRELAPIEEGGGPSGPNDPPPPPGGDVGRDVPVEAPVQPIEETPEPPPAEDDDAPVEAP
jgi:hypothetical protein